MLSRRNMSSNIMPAAKCLCYIIIINFIIVLGDTERTCDPLRDLDVTVHNFDGNTQNIKVRSTSKDLKYAIKIHIEDAIIPNLCQHGIKNMVQLSVLEIFFCDIKTTEGKAFKNLPSLRRLSMNFNHVKTIAKKTFKNLMVQILELNDNDIRTIEDGAFENMPNLEVLSLRSNALTDIKKEWFKNIPRLRVLDLSWNEIREIPGNAFVNIAGRNSAAVEGVDLYLSFNNIENIDPEAFGGFARLRKLWLDGNQIATLDERVFANLRIVHLNLSENYIVCLKTEFLRNLHTQILAVYNNQFDCDCLNNLRQWNTNTFVDVERFNNC